MTHSMEEWVLKTAIKIRDEKEKKLRRKSRIMTSVPRVA